MGAAAGFGSGRGGEIRTRDLLVPNQALYQAKLHPGPVAGAKPRPMAAGVNVSLVEGPNGGDMAGRGA